MQKRICFLSVIVLLNFVLLNCCDITPSVTVEMSKFGFHSRELLYTVHFDYRFVEKDCEYYLEQSLPAAVYISVDQLNDLQRLNMLKAIYPKFTDVEMIAEKSNPITVLIKRPVKAIDSFKLPIHFRYHAPKEDISFVTVDIENPLVYIGCKKNTVIEKEMEDTFVDSYCLDDKEFTLKIFANNEKNSACHWKLITTDTHLYSPLRAFIPIGNKNLYYVVLYATISITWIASIWTIVRTRKFPTRITKTLEEQRILEKKIK